MKFAKKFSLSAVLTMAMAMPSCSNDAFLQSDDNVTKTEKSEPVTYPDLVFKTDTMHITDENYESTFLKAAAGQFIPHKHIVRIMYFEYDDSASRRTRINCDANNQAFRLIFRHEMEHARKVHMTHNTDALSKWDRARMVIMNEIMASASEIIESQEYRRETGERFPQDRTVIWRADSAIMTRHKSIHKSMADKIPVDFTDPVIADIILECATDKFASAHNRGFYVKRIQNALKNNDQIKYKLHNQLARCFLLCIPQTNHWDGLFTYEVTTPYRTKDNVNIWDAATPLAHSYVLSKVDSIVNEDMMAGQILPTQVFEKTR